MLPLLDISYTPTKGNSKDIPRNAALHCLGAFRRNIGRMTKRNNLLAKVKAGKAFYGEASTVITAYLPKKKADQQGFRDRVNNTLSDKNGMARAFPSEKKAQKRRVAALLQARAAGNPKPSSDGKPSGAKWKPRVGLFGLKPKKPKKNAKTSAERDVSSAAVKDASLTLPAEVAWFSFHDQKHTVFTEVDVHTRVGILVDVESDAPGAVSGPSPRVRSVSVSSRRSERASSRGLRG